MADQSRQPAALTADKSPDPWDGLEPGFVRDAAADRLKALGHHDRLRIVEVLARRCLTVSEIAAAVRLPHATVSRHLRVLDAADIVRSSRSGNFVSYVLADSDVVRLALLAYRGAGRQARRRLTITER
ncbi:MAG: ArsR/SmtB family transcription factor [Solirubrobacterales bacterium]